MEIKFLSSKLEQMHLKMRELFDMVDSIGVNVFGYELAYAEGRDPFPEGEVPLYLDVLKPYLSRLAPPPASILDVGGGTGRLAIPLAREGYHVTIFEPAASGLEIAHRKATLAGVESRLSYVCGYVCDLSQLSERSFDVVLGLQSLLYLDDLKTALEMAVRAARRAVCFDVPSLYGFILGRMPGFKVDPLTVSQVLKTGVTPETETFSRERYHCYTEEQLRDIAEEAGIQVDEVVPFSFLEVLDWHGDPMDRDARELEEHFRHDDVMRQLAAFNMVLGRRR